jgi:aminomethyltransferase
MPGEYSACPRAHGCPHLGCVRRQPYGRDRDCRQHALAAVQRISSNDASKLQVGQAQYSGMLTPQGTFVDDLLVYRLGPAHFLLVVNAATSQTTRDGEQIKGGGDAVAVTRARYAPIALQGPRP